MKAAETGFVLSIDQASNMAGVSLWHNGNLKAHTVLRSNAASDSFARRLQTQVPQLTTFLDEHLPTGLKITKVLFEGMKSRLVLCTIGAFLTCPRLDTKLHAQHSFIESSSWKKWAQAHGATGPFKEIKGVKALQEVGYPTVATGITSDDVADSILMYLTWRSKL